MKRVYRIILGFTFLLLLGCGGGSSNSTNTDKQNVPKSPVVSEKEKVPPAIPNI